MDLSTIRLLRYRKDSKVKAIDGADLGLGSILERDTSVFTSGWNDVVFGDDFLQEIEGDESATLLVNTGALMARWTNDTWRATTHRVVEKPEARCFHRYSIASFFDLDNLEDDLKCGSQVCGRRRITKVPTDI